MMQKNKKIWPSEINDCFNTYMQLMGDEFLHEYLTGKSKKKKKLDAYETGCNDKLFQAKITAYSNTYKEVSSESRDFWYISNDSNR